jgi:hypothetical protein
MEELFGKTASVPNAWLVYVLIAAAALIVVFLLWIILTDRKRKEKRWRQMDESALEQYLIRGANMSRDELAFRIGKRPDPKRDPKAYRQYLRKLQEFADNETRYEYSSCYGPRPDPDLNPKAYSQYLQRKYGGHPQDSRYAEEPEMPFSEPSFSAHSKPGPAVSKPVYPAAPKAARESGPCPAPRPSAELMQQDTGSFAPIRDDSGAPDVSSCMTPDAGAGSREQIARAEQEWEQSVRTDRIRFSALTNRTAEKGNWLLIDLYAYEDAFRHLVDEAIAQAEEPMQEKQSGYRQVQEGQRISVNLRSPDIGFDELQEMPWAGGFLDFSFAAEIPQDYAKEKILFIASVSLDGIPVTKLNFIAAVKGEKAPAEIERKDIRSAFVSYASTDREAVTLLIMGMKKVNPKMDLFFDVENISTGSYWEDVLKKEILDRDILFLCWSRNARTSEWVDREWRYAYEQKGIDAVEPLPLEPPENCPPPAELQRKHFNNILLYVAESKKQEKEKSWVLQDIMTGKLWPLNGSPLWIGRGADCDVTVTEDRTVSRMHCALVREGNRVVLSCKGVNGLLLFRDRELRRVGNGETVSMEQSYYMRVGEKVLFRICTDPEKGQPA